MSVTRPLLFVVTGLFACGCGSDPMNAGSVRGKVFVDGQLLTKGAVRFVPDKAKGNTAGTEPIGIIGEDGSYELAAFGKVGAPLGWYKVAVTATDPPDSSKPALPINGTLRAGFWANSQPAQKLPR